MKQNKKPSRLSKAIVEMAKDMRSGDMLDEETYKKITSRHLGLKEKVNVETLTGDDIRAMREQAHMSQSVFAHYLNLTADYVSKLERGVKHPKGPALVLLNVIHRKGIETITG